MSGPTEKNWIANLVAVGIGCAVVVLALVAIQWFFGQSDMDRRHAKIKDDVSEAFYDSNSDEFGWKFIPNVKSHVVRKIGDQVVYDFHLTIDQYGRRVVQHEEKMGHLLMEKPRMNFCCFLVGPLWWVRAYPMSRPWSIAWGRSYLNIRPTTMQ